MPPRRSSDPAPSPGVAAPETPRPVSPRPGPSARPASFLGAALAIETPETLESGTPHVPAWPASPSKGLVSSPRDVTAPSIAPDPPPVSSPAPTFDRSDVMAPLPEVIEPAPGPRFGYEAAPASPSYPALTPSEALTPVSPEVAASSQPRSPVPMAAPAAVPGPAAASLPRAPVTGPEAAAAPSRTGADPDAWAHASWNAYAHKKPTTDTESLSWEGPAVDIPGPAPMPRELDASRLLTTLPPPRASRLPSWWRVGGLATASALLAAFGALALMPARSATPVASNLSDVNLELPAEPAASLAAEPAPIAAVDDGEGALDEEVEEAAPASEESTAGEAPQAEKAAPKKAPAKATARPPRTASRRWSRPAPRSRSGFLAAIAERKRTMGYIVARATQPCVFYVDGTPHGAGRVLKIQAHPGAHRVTCRTEDGRQSQSVRVRSRQIAGAVFRL